MTSLDITPGRLYVLRMIASKSGITPRDRRLCGAASLLVPGLVRAGLIERRSGRLYLTESGATAVDNA